MPTRKEPVKQHTAEPAGPYLNRLGDEDRAAYEATTSDLDLSFEIRFMRTVLSRLSEDIPGNKAVISAGFNALVRAISVQAGQLGASDAAESDLRAAAERVLREQQATANDHQEV